MKKYKDFNKIWKIKEYPTAEPIVHIAFYAIRLTLFILIRLLNPELIVRSNKMVAAANNYILKYSLSLFLLFYVLYCLLTGNIYGYCLSVVLMFHNFLFTLVISILARFDADIKLKYWAISIAMSITYVIEIGFTVFFIYKRRVENSRSIFQKIGADPKINDIYSIRQRLQTFGVINLFIPILIIQKLYLIPDQFELKSEMVTIVVLVLTGCSMCLSIQSFMAKI
ncbi:uncharacterized protein VICG_01841 [Vittaforma corneae ATCC 50505]|uniref:Uncharacterized protein n=1 Tax=Vittaforma corneae (strain ATCC 50505) TaxID=993615 RepID=L2GLJ1_VITCO|nr:uncharacterized protein VICG_01841 [Vittaforma corneae ATCC 50505]ELA41142.1 hypothetical protein VICG_01841 [Vittaforma corneae ATCC 50505]